MHLDNETLPKHLHITDTEIEQRKRLLDFSEQDRQILLNFGSKITQHAHNIVSEFYHKQLVHPEIAMLINDISTLTRLFQAQKQYIIELFSGHYDADYVNNRLRIGLVHKHSGVEPKLYLAGVCHLKEVLTQFATENALPNQSAPLCSAVEKIITFDTTLVFDTYISSLLTEVEVSKEKVEKYAVSLKEKSDQLEILSHTDPLTGLLNTRRMSSIAKQVLSSAKRRNESVTLVFFDINDFKLINDNEGHRRGDSVLKNISQVIQTVSREEDHCFRYGGDEFCILMASCTQLEAENLFGKRLMQELQYIEPNVTLSIGYAESPPKHPLSPEEIIHLADEDMYRAKARHKKVSNSST